MRKVHTDGCDLGACGLFKCSRCNLTIGKCYASDGGRCEMCVSVQRRHDDGLCVMTGCLEAPVPRGILGAKVLCEEHWNGVKQFITGADPGQSETVEP